MPKKSSRVCFRILEKINSHVMEILYTSLWHRDRDRNEQDEELKQKIEMLNWITPDLIELPDHECTYDEGMWQIAVNYIKEMEQ